MGVGGEERKFTLGLLEDFYFFSGYPTLTFCSSELEPDNPVHIIGT